MSTSDSDVLFSVYKERAVDWVYEDSGEAVMVLDPDGILFNDIRKIIDAISIIEAECGDVFTLKVYDEKNGIFIDEKARVVASATLVSVVNIERCLGYFKLNPKILAWIRVRGSVEVPNPFRLGRNECSVFFEKINVFVDLLRNELRSVEVKKDLSKYRRASNKNYRSLVSYIDSLFLRYSRLLVLRVDFGYKKFGCYFSDDVELAAGELVSSYALISEHRETLISHVKNDENGYSMVGYVWKLEYGVAKGYHYHMIFFLDGSKVRQDISIAKNIGEYWSGDITRGEGIYFNCNLKKETYKMCGVGMISHYETDKINNLKKAAIYLAKIDRIISVCVPGSGRCFGKGRPPKKAKCLGRPRKKAVAEAECNTITGLKQAQHDVTSLLSSSLRSDI